MKIAVIFNRLGGIQIVVNKQYVIEDYEATGDFIAEAIVEKAQREGWSINEQELKHEDEKLLLLHPTCGRSHTRNRRPRKVILDECV